MPTNKHKRKGNRVGWNGMGMEQKNKRSDNTGVGMGVVRWECN